jgi:hypothetical protein
MTTRLALTALLVGASLAAPNAAGADPVSDWNAITTMYVYGNPTANPAVPVGRGGPPGLLDIALVHVAIHDAVQAIEGRFQPYHYSAPSHRGVGDRAAAVAAAAHRVLVLLYPGQQSSLDTRYEAYLTAHGLTGDPGLETGEAAAAAVHANHYRPAIAMLPFLGVEQLGKWRSAVPMAALYLAFVEPFTLTRPSQFRPPPPPPIWSRVYSREYDEVKRLGSSISHPNADTDTANFWYTVDYFKAWNETVRQLASTHLNVGDSARLFALTSLAVADAAIAIWDSKRFYNFWRPSTAILEGDRDRNQHTAGDSTWMPYRNNPPYPDYVSGANGITAAFTGTLRLFFGTDEMAFSVKNPDPTLFSQERHFKRFSDVEEEVVEARILVGIHFRAADEEARRLGVRVAHWTFMRFLRPTPRHE